MDRSVAVETPLPPPAPLPAAAAGAAGSLPALDGAAVGADGPAVLLLLADVAAAWRLWGWSRFVFGGLPLRGTPGLRFARQMGSGHDGGFGLRPSGSRQALLLVFDDAPARERFVAGSALLARLRGRSDESCLLRLRPCSSRGSWAGVSLPALSGLSALPAAPGPGQPVAALTRASIRPSRAAAFWRMAPAAQADLAGAPGCRLAVGLGEAPLLRQATFSLWDDAAALEAYARGGAHRRAAQAAAAQGFFSESMFVRFVPESVHGRWKGVAHG